MGRTTVFCLLSVLALAQASSQSTKLLGTSMQASLLHSTVSSVQAVSSQAPQHSTKVMGTSMQTSLLHSTVASVQASSTQAPQHSTRGVSTGTVQQSSMVTSASAAQASSVQASSTQKTQMSTKTVSVTVQPSAVVSSPSNMQSATPSPSQKPTPPLTSAMSSHPAVQTSTPVTPKSTPVRPFITPSRTALMATETVQLNDNGTLCLYARLEVDFEIRYNTTKSKEKGTAVNTTETANIPLNGFNGFNGTIDITGSCSYKNGSAHFVMTWNELGSGPQHHFKMYFNRSGTQKWTVPTIMAMFNTSDRYAFHGKPTEPEVIASASGKKMFGEQKKDSSYVCKSEENLQMSSGVTAKFSNVVLKPFSSEKPDSHEQECPADKSDDGDDNTVPIAVGAALGGLVLIVLIAYIIGRRRSTSGYEQV